MGSLESVEGGDRTTSPTVTEVLKTFCEVTCESKTMPEGFSPPSLILVIATLLSLKTRL